MRRTILAGIAALVAALGLAPAGHAQTYPTRPVTLMVAFTPAGPSDVLARVVGRKLEELLKQPFVVVNRPGAGGNIGAEAVATAPADGYTLLMGNNSILATNASLYKKLPYDPEKDFKPISLVGNQANILVVNPKLPVKSMSELIGLAKAMPGQLNYASSGIGTAAHLAGALFRAQANIDIVHVAYKGAAPALQDVISGQVQMMFATAASVVGFINSGLARPLAVTTPAPQRAVPRSAHGRRAGPAGLRGNHLARPGGAGRHPAGRGRYPARRHHQGVARPGARQIVDRARSRDFQQHARPVRQIYYGRNSQVDRRGEGLGRDPRLR